MISVDLDTASKEDLKKLEDAFKDLPNAIRTMLDDPGKTLRNQAIGASPYLTGALKRSWSPLQRNEGGLSFHTDLPYAIVLEQGLYRGVGPRTVMMSSGIFSRQAPEGILEPLLKDENIKRITDAVVKHFEKVIGGSE